MTNSCHFLNEDCLLESVPLPFYSGLSPRPLLMLLPNMHE